MTKLHSILTVALILLAISAKAQKYNIFQYDNGDDYIREGLRRIVDDAGKIGYADENGNVVIKPRFAFAFPFENGMAKVTDTGHSIHEGEHLRWVSSEWYFIDHTGYEVIRERRYAQIEQRLETYIRAQDARIGVAVIINSIDTVQVNGKRDFPMFSIYALPQAVTVADYCLKHKYHSNPIFIKSTWGISPTDPLLYSNENENQKNDKTACIQSCGISADDCNFYCLCQHQC